MNTNVIEVNGRLLTAEEVQALLIAAGENVGVEEDEVSLKDRLGGVVKASVKPATVVAGATGALVGKIGRRLDDRKSIKASIRNYKNTVVIPEGRAIREAFAASRAAVVAEEDKSEGGE